MYINLGIFFQQMVYAVKSLALICKLKKNPKLSVECYERTLQAIHVTLADTIRENNKVKMLFCLLN